MGGTAFRPGRRSEPRPPRGGRGGRVCRRPLRRQRPCARNNNIYDVNIKKHMGGGKLATGASAGAAPAAPPLASSVALCGIEQPAATKAPVYYKYVRTTHKHTPGSGTWYRDPSGHPHEFMQVRTVLRGFIRITVTRQKGADHYIANSSTAIKSPSAERKTV